MPRNAEVIRQWTILRAIELSRTTGVTIDHLADECGVTTRTIRRDLQALEEAGFPVYDDRGHDDGRTRWKINGQAFRGLTAGLTLSELCALYFGRTLLEALAGTPFKEDLERAFDKLSHSLTPHMRQFLDQLPRVIASKPDPLRRRLADDDPGRQQTIARALEATLFNRQALVTYHSRSSERTKQYLVHPHRLAYAQGGLYLLAYVPEYEEIRTFAVERIEDFSLLEEKFTPIEDLPDEAFPHSLGVHSGAPEHIALEFQPGIVDYLKTREWHPSQRFEDLPDGGTRMALDVCVDHALRSWILSFGPAVRVVSPATLAGEIASQLEAAASSYSEAGQEPSRRHEGTKSS